MQTMKSFNRYTRDQLRFMSKSAFNAAMAYGPGIAPEVQRIARAALAERSGPVDIGIDDDNRLHVRDASSAPWTLG